MGIATDIMRFFWADNARKGDDNKLYPKTIGDFAREFRLSNEFEVKYRLNDIFLTCEALKRKGFLWQAGVFFDSSPSLNEPLYSYIFDEREASYGTYEYIAFGFPIIRESFAASVIALETIDKKGQIGIGSAFVHNTQRIITCRHCVENMREIILHSSLFINSNLKSIFVPSNKGIDLAVLTFEKDTSLQTSGFSLAQNKMLDNVMVMGYPPIPGFQTILVSETAQISGYLKSSTGQIIAQDSSYLDGQEYMLITARVKGGNSGGPVVGEQGKVVGIVTQVPEDDGMTDLLGYAVALPAQAIGKFLIDCESMQDNVIELPFKLTHKGFSIVL